MPGSDVKESVCPKKLVSTIVNAAPALLSIEKRIVYRIACSPTTADPKA